MNILIIDTATEACSVALQFNHKLYTEYEICPQQHSQKILPMVESVLKSAGAQLSALDVLGFGRGPGSFTGVRIATGIIQGLALGTNLPVVGVSTLAAMAQQALHNSAKDKVAVAIDARMSEVYFAQYARIGERVKPVEQEIVSSPEMVLSLLDANTTVFAGTGWHAYPELANWLNGTEVTVTYPFARFMIELGIQAFENGEAVRASDVAPEYVRDTVTWKKLPGR